jgi:hypothetical protein
MDPDPHGFAFILVAGSGSGTRTAKITHKNIKEKYFHVLRCWMFFRGHEASPTDLTSFLGIIANFDFEKKRFFFSCTILPFLVIQSLGPDPELGIRTDLKCWILIRIHNTASNLSAFLIQA